jgi:tetratricopeptide (TPR) repeat protein
MHLRFGWGIPTIFFSVLLGLASAQTGKISFEGYVRDELTQQPVAAARVELTTLSGDPVGLAAISGSSGEFRLIDVDSGSYSISVERSGYQLASIPVGNLTQSNLVVMLRRLAAGGDSSTSNPTSIRELSIPGKARAAFEKGVGLLTRSDADCAGAMRQFQRAIKESPTYYEAYAEMSIAQFRLGDGQSAERSLLKSIELSENRYAKALALMAELRNSQGRFAEAETAARQAIAVDELSAQAHTQLARALSGLRRPSEAEASAKRALELQPGNPLISLVLGNIHLQQHNLAAAVQDFDSYLSRVPRGEQSDLVRRSRDQAQHILAAQQAPAGVQGP